MKGRVAFQGQFPIQGREYSRHNHVTFGAIYPDGRLPTSPRPASADRSKEGLFRALFLYTGTAHRCLTMQGVKQPFSKRAALLHGRRQPLFTPFSANPTCGRRHNHDNGNSRESREGPT
jgi:hypothetical protein